MIKTIKILSACFLAMLLLVACGTTGREEANLTNGSGAGGNQEKNDAPKKEEKAADEIEKEEPEAESDDSVEEEDTSQKIRLFEMNLTYSINEKTKEDTAFLRSSDNQDYSLYVLPEFELTGEEPNKDVLYLKENDRHFMRIELLPNESNIDEAVQTIKDQLTAVNSNVKQLKAEDSQKWLENAHIFQAENNEERVTAYIINKGDFILKLSIFTKIEDNYIDPFLKMAETIEKK
ncbi:hypothetical protein KHA96_06375 [Bacillus sp. FJAT-49711]|uniref:hypothetical protein n=1 Tax=Bacillus sp. FJAT-49711 TaxID=2833585 RepID=UPI001BCA4304|nr:hypothetical protein [Bacillus sp. FJAT-49711]MBS4217947.1 hypothetical protein [Bacillus sp. FJAT-49711]